ncbi:non-ribosomal peptide synthetase [Brevibacillus dissolubilis]|uniref:non-ribosomal peptide synthetase n=1 Tax=Brevibacillus dissolubilis TaxID=1844116 RepID=UPI00159BBE74|nr:non-ribosomal peptide synthetase [Brevibacillus dissolubilis]
MLNLNLMDHNFNEETHTETVQIEETSTQDIAIIGLAARLPASSDLHEFWSKLCEGRDFVKEFPAARKADLASYMKKLNWNPSRVTFYEGAYLDEIDKFDHAFFRLSPNEASYMSPNQRLFLETAWQAMEDAGYSSARLAGSRTGVYLGYNGDAVHDYKRLIEMLDPEAMSLAAPGNVSSMIAGRIAYLLDLKGPSLCIDTACSSSLVAVHMASQALRRGECDMMLVGSVKINLLPADQGIRIGIESSDCRAKTFDDAADGTGIGDGVVALLLKPLDKALQDRDHIHAVLKGSAVNQDGSSAGITAPNALAQEDVIVRAWEDAGIDPTTVSYIEAHGTGTALGDPIELDGITRAFRRYTGQNQFCAISSLKTNIGHLDHAAGIAGLLKAVLCLKHSMLPPTVHFQNPNSNIDFLQSPVYVNNELAYWEAEGGPRRCGVSAFGMSGTNCHVVLEEAPEVEKEWTTVQGAELAMELEKPLHWFSLSAKTELSLWNMVEKYKQFVELDSTWSLADLCYTAHTGREHFGYRLALIAGSEEEFVKKIRGLDLERLKQGGLEDVYYSHAVEQKQTGGAEERTQTGDVLRDRQHGDEEELVSDLESVRAFCIRYVQGEQLDWHGLYRGQQRWRVPLPTYAFERKRCWIEDRTGDGYGITSMMENTGSTDACFHAVDTARLSKPQRHQVTLTGESTREYTTVELAVAQIWGEVLGYTEIGLHQNYYELGGDSIIALKIINRINDQFNTSVEIADVLRYPTIEGLAVYLDHVSNTPKSAYADSLETPQADMHATAIVPAPPNAYYPITSAQRRLYIMHQVDPQNTSYHLPEMLHLTGQVDVERLEQVFCQLIDRHEILRTSFDVIDGEIVQIVHENIDFQINCIQTADDELQEMIQQFVKPFDLTKPPLIRVTLLSQQEHKHLLLIDLHHIVFDGTSSGIILSEMMALYEGKELSPLPVQYKDFAVWIHSQLVAGGLDRQKAFWLQQLAGELPVLQLPTDYPRPLVKSYEGATFEVTIDADLAKKLNQLARQSNSTLFTVLLAGYNILLAKYSGQEDIIVGTPIAGRTNKVLESIAGMFVNTLALRNYPQADKSFGQFLQEVRENTYQSFHCQDYPFEELVTLLDAGDKGRNPLFDTMFIMQNMEIPPLTLGEVTCIHQRYEHGTAKFDLMIQALEQDGQIRLVVEYATKLFHAGTVEKMMRHYLQILAEVAKNPEQELSQIEMLSNEERRQLTVDFNVRVADFGDATTITEQFELQAIRYPDQVAVRYRGDSMTYRELNEKASQLAKQLRKKGVQTGSLVGIMMERSIEMMIGMLAILKAGGAYVPIDPAHPQERILYMLTDSGAQIVLTAGTGLEQIGFAGEWMDLTDERVYLDGLSEDGQVDRDGDLDGTEAGKCSHPERSSSPDQLMYVIYTSGSTGQPKGVMVPHKAFYNFAYSMHAHYRGEIGPRDRFLSLTNISFDVSVCELFVPLMFGATLVLFPSPMVLDCAELAGVIVDESVTFAYIPPTILKEVCEAIRATGRPVALDKMLVGVEPIKDETLEQFVRLNPAIQIVNGYGPTETTICSNMYVYQPGSAKGQNVPIGKPLHHNRVYILDKGNQPVPVGVAGELCVAGAGLADGYWKKPELTREKFVPDPFVAGERMYRTGDMAKWLPDGNVVFLGRVDHQVKIRGYRIELGEIETQLLAYQGVSEALVIAHESADSSESAQQPNRRKDLVAYYVADHSCSISELRKFLLQKLPEYMIPAFFIQLDEMPLTLNGKIDRKALPAPSADLLHRTEYVAPRNEMEQLLAQIWQEVLGIREIGIQDHFYELGGDSIKALQILFKLQAQGYTLQVRDLLQHATIEAVAPLISVKQSVTDQSPVVGEQLLTPIQTWFFEQRFTDAHHWNQAVMLHHPQGYEEQLLREAFQKIVEHHDVFRLAFHSEDGNVMAHYREEQGELFTLQVIEISDEADEQSVIEREANRVQSSLDLENGPTIRLALFKTSHGDHLLIVIHHLVVDAVSWRILFEDFVTAYTQAANHLPIELPIKTDSYQTWAKQLHEYANSRAMQKERAYWQEIEQTPIKPLPNDSEYNPTDQKQGASESLSIQLSQEETSELLTRVHYAYNTEINDILLTALAMTMRNWTEEERIVVQLEGHGREEILPNVNIYRTIGWFTCQYPVVLQAKEGEDTARLIKGIKEQLKKIPNKGVGYGILKHVTAKETARVEAGSLAVQQQGTESNEDFGLGQNEFKPQLSFNYLGQFDADIQTDLFTISPYGSGQAMSPNGERWCELEWNGLIRDGRLLMQISYHRGAFHRETIESLLTSYQANLQHVINHCLGQEEKESTPSDFGEDEMSMEELDELMDLLGDLS